MEGSWLLAQDIDHLLRTRRHCIEPIASDLLFHKQVTIMCLFSWNLMSHQESNCPEFLKGRSAAEFSFLILPLKAVRLVSIFVVVQTNVLTDLLRTGWTQVAFHKALGNKLVCSCFIQCHRKLQSFMNAITTNSVINKIPKRHPKYFVGLFSPTIVSWKSHKPTFWSSPLWVTINNSSKLRSLHQLDA